MQLGMAFWGSKTLLSAIELDVFGALAKGPRKGATLAGELGLHERSARDFLDALVALGMLRSRRRRVLATRRRPTCSSIARSPHTSAAARDGQRAGCIPSGVQLTEALRTGPAAERSEGRRRLLRRRCTERPSCLKQFLGAMTRHQHGRGDGDRRAVPVGEVPTFVDVGAAQGCVPVQVALRAPASAGRRLRPAAGRAGLRGVRGIVRAPRPCALLHAGDFFRNDCPDATCCDGPHPPRLGPRGEAHAARARPTTRCRRRRAHRLRSDHRRRTTENAFGLLMSLNMLIETPGGIRLHRRRLQRLDAGSRVPRNATPSRSSDPTPWSWASSSTTRDTARVQASSTRRPLARSQRYAIRSSNHGCSRASRIRWFAELGSVSPLARGSPSCSARRTDDHRDTAAEPIEEVDPSRDRHSHDRDPSDDAGQPSCEARRWNHQPASPRILTGKNLVTSGFPPARIRDGF